MDPQRFDPGNSARRPTVQRSDLGILPYPAGRARPSPGALSPGREPRPAPSAVRSPAGKVPRARIRPVRRELQPAVVDTSRGRGRLRRMVSVSRCPSPDSPDLRVTASSVRGNRGAGAPPGMPGLCEGSVANRSVLHPTRLETRTKESNVCASHGDSCIETHGRNESEGGLRPFPRQDPFAGRTAGPSQRHRSRGGARAHTLGPERW